MSNGAAPKRVLLVTGLSGAGKASILHVLEDLGYQAVDNPPLDWVEVLVKRSDRRIAVGIDARSSGFAPAEVLRTLERLRLDPALAPELIFATAEDDVLLRRYTETRRRHPLAPGGRVADGIAAERAVTAGLHRAADMVVDTSDLPPAGLRRLIEERFGEPGGAESPHAGLSIALISFAYPQGLPREAELVFDARFLRNPHYEPLLRPHTGLDPDVAAYIETDPDFTKFFTKLVELLALVLPRFVHEGKKYATIAIGCTGGRHRSVHLIEKLAVHLVQQGWRINVTHRELDSAREAARRVGDAAEIQAQEA